jgi:phage terminase small subunit
MKKTDWLTQKQKMFCLEYLKSFNATDAYRKVYWGQQKTCEVNGCKLLSNTKVADYLAEKTKKKTEKLDVWVDYVLENLKEIVEIWMWKREVSKNWENVTILDLGNANSALEKLWKYNKMYTDKVEQDTSIQFKIVSFKKWEK